MIEAIHLGPWLDEMAHRERHQVTAVVNLLDCEDCKRRNGKEKRQMHGCGFEEPVKGTPGIGGYVGPWAPSGYLEAADGKRPDTCIGYGRRIPLVKQLRWDRLHWERASLGLVYEEISDEHWSLLEHLEGAIAAKDRWALDNPHKKPGQP